MNAASLVLRSVPLCFALLCCASASARDPSQTDPLRIHVVDVAGEVAVTMRGVEHDVAPSDVMELPSRIGTGDDGRLGLAQGATSIVIGPNSDVEIPPAAAKGQLIARLVQHRGNVFYDVAPRGVDKLRVESPLLVAVVKGTQFNVTVQDGRTTISLFEGLLEIRTPEGDQITELRAGEIAIRSRDDAAIRIVRMDEEPVAASQPAARVDAGPAGPAAADASVALSLGGGFTPADAPVLGGDIAAALNATAETGIAAALGGAPALDISGSSDAALGSIVNAPLAVDLEVAEGGIAVDLGAGGAGIGAALDVGDSGLSAALDAGASLGGATVDLGLDTSLDLGAGSVGAGLDAGVDLGAAEVGLGLDTTVELGAGGITADLGLDGDIGLLDTDLGLDADLGIDADLELGSPSLDTGLDADASVAGLDAGATVGAGLDSSGLDVNVGLDVGGLEIDVDLDGSGLGLALGLGGAGGGLLGGGGLL